jgi:hypothetical protein
MNWRLQERLYWRDKEGKRWVITGMSTQYIKNVMGYLWRRKAAIRLVSDMDDLTWYNSPMGPQGEMARDDIGEAIAIGYEESDEDWITRQPLWKAFEHELMRRGVSHEFFFHLLDPANEREEA